MSSRHRVQMRWGDIDGARPRQPRASCSPTSRRAATRSSRERGISRDEYVVGRCEVMLAARDPTRPSRGHRRVRGHASSARSSMTTRERILDAEGEVARRGRVRARALGRGAARLAPDHRRASAPRWRGSGGGTEMSAWNSRPRRHHLRDHRRRRLPRHQPEHPVHDRGDRRLGDRRGRGGRDDRPPARARGRRHAERPARAVRRRDRPDPRRLPDLLTMVSTGGANDMTIERAHDRPRGEAGHLRASSRAR